MAHDEPNQSLKAGQDGPIHRTASQLPGGVVDGYVTYHESSPGSPPPVKTGVCVVPEKGYGDPVVVVSKEAASW